MTDTDKCSICGRREGENHDLPGRCVPRMVTIPATQLDRLTRELEEERAFTEEVLGNVALAYDHVTQGTFTKATTDPVYIKDAFDEALNRAVREAEQEAREEAQAELTRMRLLCDEAADMRDLLQDKGFGRLLDHIDAYSAAKRSEPRSTDELIYGRVHRFDFLPSAWIQYHGGEADMPAALTKLAKMTPTAHRKGPLLAPEGETLGEAVAASLSSVGRDGRVLVWLVGPSMPRPWPRYLNCPLIAHASIPDGWIMSARVNGGTLIAEVQHEDDAG